VRTYYCYVSKPSYREDILAAGLKVMFQAGYQGASVRDICAAAGAPHGSFTNHFRSKEAFAQEVLDRYFANLQVTIRDALEDCSRTPKQRLKRYLDIISGLLADDRWNRGCLIGDFSVETTVQSEILRQRLEAIFQEWCAPFAACIAEAQSMGEIDTTFAATDLAEFLLASWEGAILRMKVERGPAALDRFKTIVFQTVFAQPTAKEQQ
jgi:TetR/AcrR family transcriptional regulator, transcriptional repressor for nem operon